MGEEEAPALTAVPWRLIDTGELSGAENMAIDEALLSCFTPGESAPVLRLYGWSPPAFSYGRFQNPEEIINLDRCRSEGIQVVRRITGGGVLYHARELTYSLACPADFLPDSRSVKDAFFRLTSFLMAFYKSLGLPALHAVDHYSGDQRVGERTPLCFSGVESCDILINGRKIGGNAQRRLKNVIFQHGSIPMQQMADKAGPYLLQPDNGIIDKTTALADQRVDLDRESLASLLKTSVEQSLRVIFMPDQLTERERKCAAEYMQNFA